MQLVTTLGSSTEEPKGRQNIARRVSAGFKVHSSPPEKPQRGDILSPFGLSNFWALGSALDQSVDGAYFSNMPIYEYHCDACDQTNEVLQKADEPMPAACPKCGKPNTLHKIISHTSFQLKGGGWYNDLYSSAKPAEKSAACEPACTPNACAKKDPKPTAD